MSKHKFTQKLIGLSFFVILLSGITTACGSNVSPIVGQWQRSPNSTTSSPIPTSSDDLIGDPLGDLGIGDVFVDPFGDMGTGGVPSCDAFYPDVIEFFKGGTYAGQLDSVWSNGRYEIAEEGRIRLDTTQGELSKYGYTISENVLIFTDDSGCDIKYQRVP